jgi:cytidyltransferase-like protein
LIFVLFDVKKSLPKDPIHYGHVEMLNKAKSLARTADGPGTLWVIINNDAQAARKKGKEFMPAAERLKLVRSLRCVDACIIAPNNDTDDVVEAIEAIHPDIFAIGLDEGPDYMKDERKKCKEMGIEIVCPLGLRVQSSSYLLAKAREEAEKKRVAEEAKKAAAAGTGGSTTTVTSPEKKTKLDS